MGFLFGFDSRSESAHQIKFGERLAAIDRLRSRSIGKEESRYRNRTSAFEREVDKAVDITFKTQEGRFNYRVCAMIVHDGKILAMKDQVSPYYYLPGGRVHLHEAADDAVIREVKEELGVEAKIDRPLWLNQGFFTEDVTGEQFHEVCLYYLMDISGTDLLSRGEIFTCREGNRIQQYCWLPFDCLEDAYFYPKFLKKKIFHLPEELTLQAEYE